MLFDQQKLQKCILQVETEQWSMKSDSLDWVKKEGTMHPDFLHLEDDMHQSIDITTIQDSLGNEVEGEDVLKVL